MARVLKFAFGERRIIKTKDSGKNNGFLSGKGGE